MKFKKGSLVEVFRGKEVPTGSWHCAKIISGNGHNYNVRYISSGTSNNSLVEKVSRKVIRPSPPPLDGTETWLRGDIVEVFVDSSWETAVILEASGNYFLVRLIGSFLEFRVHKSNIRIRQSWHENKWFVIGKGCMNCDSVKPNKPSTSNCHQSTSFPMIYLNRNGKLPTRDHCLAFQNNTGVQESHIVSSKSLKRASPYYSSKVETYTTNVKKLRAINKDGRPEVVITTYAPPLQEKVDAIAFPGELSNNRNDGFCDIERDKSIDFDSECSVGSCSITSNKCPNLVGSLEDIDTCSSDTESSTSLYNKELEKCPVPTNKVLEVKIHSLELKAYGCTLDAFYASGPLSWEQEALLTDLRVVLHISNDEHLIEVKRIISGRKCLPLGNC